MSIEKFNAATAEFREFPIGPALFRFKTHDWVSGMQQDGEYVIYFGLLSSRRKRRFILRRIQHDSRSKKYRGVRGIKYSEGDPLPAGIVSKLLKDDVVAWQEDLA